MLTHVTSFVFSLKVSSQNMVFQSYLLAPVFLTSFSQVILYICNTIMFISHCLHSILGSLGILVGIFEICMQKFTICDA